MNRLRFAPRAEFFHLELRMDNDGFVAPIPLEVAIDRRLWVLIGRVDFGPETT